MEKFVVKIDPLSRIALPDEIRQQMALDAFDDLNFGIKDGKIIIEKQKTEGSEA